MTPLSAYPLRLWIVCALAGNALAATPDPSGGRIWIAHSDQDIVSLAYGLPESDDVPLSLICDRAAKTVTVVYQTTPVANPDPETLPMQLSAGEARLTLTAKGGRSELDDLYILEATTGGTPELATIFVQPGVLSVTVEGRSKEFPLDDVARKGGEEIVSGCGG